MAAKRWTRERAQHGPTDTLDGRWEVRRLAAGAAAGGRRWFVVDREHPASPRHALRFKTMTEAKRHAEGLAAKLAGAPPTTTWATSVEHTHADGLTHTHAGAQGFTFAGQVRPDTLADDPHEHTVVWFVLQVTPHDPDVPRPKSGPVVASSRPDWSAPCR